MALPEFDFHEPCTMDEACWIMTEKGGEARPIAGGTDLIVKMKKKVLSPGHLVSLSKIPTLNNIDIHDSSIRIGSCVTASDLAESGYVRAEFGALSKGAAGLGSPLIRNLATIGGNIVSARPAADLPPPLMAYGTKVVLRGKNGHRVIPLENFFQGPGQTVAGPEEILTEIIVKRPGAHAGAGYIKLGARKALEISLVNVATFISLDCPGGTIQEARIVLGAVAPTPIRACFAEEFLLGKRPGQALFARAGELAALGSKPIDDFRGSAAYRMDMVDVLTRRTLDIALTEACAERRPA